MKRNKIAIIGLSAALAVSAAACLAGCAPKPEVKGPQYEYNVIAVDNDYEFKGNPKTTVTPDAGITIDGKFDEEFYKDRNWIKAKKVIGNETGTLEATTYFAGTGFVVAAKITDSRVVYHTNKGDTGQISTFNCYFAFGGDKDLYEIECSAGERFRIRKWSGTDFNADMNFSIDQMPVVGVQRHGKILEGECHAYDIEYFIPYASLGRTGRPDFVYLNPTIISCTLLANTDEPDTKARTWYNIGYEQTPDISHWGQVNQGYTFDEDGFVSYKLDIQATGGTVSDPYGYDWCVKGHTVTLSVTAEEGKTLKSFKVNGKESASEVLGGSYSFVAERDMKIEALFE